MSRGGNKMSSKGICCSNYKSLFLSLSACLLSARVCSCAGVRFVHGSVRTSSSSWGRSSQQKHKEISLPFTHVTRYMNTPPLSAGGRPARANLSPCSLSPTPDVGRRVLQGLGGGMWSLSVCVCWWGGCGALCTDTCVCVRMHLDGRWGVGDGVEG